MWAQLNVMPKDENEHVMLRAGSMLLTEENQRFWLCSKDYRSANYVNLCLGETWAQARISIQQLYEWFNNASVQDDIVVEQEDGQMTIYKASKTLCLISPADAKTCAATYKSAMEAAFIDVTFAIGLLESTEFIGLCSKTRMKQIYKFAKIHQ